MRVKALKNFVGETYMSIAEEKEIPDEKAERLIRIGYVEAVTLPPEKTSEKIHQKGGDGGWQITKNFQKLLSRTWQRP